MGLIDDAKAAAQKAQLAVAGAAVRVAPEAWLPGGLPDPLIVRRGGHVGRPMARVDGVPKVTGSATFAAEYAHPGMVYAALAYGTVATGRIETLDVEAAEGAEGVLLVMTYRNALRMRPMPRFFSAALAVGNDDLPIMQDDRVLWNGQPIALVLADTQERADHAASLIAVTYADCGGSVTDLSEARRIGTEAGSFGGQPLRATKGDADAAMRGAAVVVDREYSTSAQSHNAMEPHAATVRWEGDRLVVQDASQAVTHASWTLAQVFGIQPDAVRVTSPFVGGAFGAKTVWQHQVLAAAASRLSGRPVRIALSREGVYRIVGPRAATEQRVALGADRDGALRAIIHRGISVQARHGAMPEPFVTQTRSAYRCGAIATDVEVAILDLVANTAMRAPGEAVGSFALESAIDELAHELGIDPIELRIRNEPTEDPLTGQEFSSRNVVKAWRDGARRFGWDRRPSAPGSRLEGEWRVGMGCAMASYPYARFPGGAARITVRRDGGVHVATAAHDMGMGTATAQIQVAADRLGVPPERISFEYGDSTLPGQVIAGGSQQTASIGSAVAAAHRALVAELLKLAGNDSPLAGLDVDEVHGVDDGLAALADPGRWEGYSSILGRARRELVTVDADAPPPLEAMRWSMHSYGAVFCEARVSDVTGEIRIPRLLGSYDCGRILNPRTAASQFRGGMVMGLGLALSEETMFDARSGRVMNPGLAEYHVPVHLDVPAIDLIWTDIPDPHAPMGARGIGEIGVTGVAAAVANAVFNATGTRVRSLPITLDKLL